MHHLLHDDALVVDRRALASTTVPGNKYGIPQARPIGAGDVAHSAGVGILYG